MPLAHLIRVSSILLVVLQCSAATYYVSTAGNNSDPGTSSQPWRTIAKAASTMVAGDTVFIREGDYGEYITSGAHGSSGSPITYSVDRTNGIIKLRQFRANHRYQVLDSLNIVGTIDTNIANANNAHVRVETIATGLIVTNCFIGNTAWAAHTNCIFVVSNSQTPPTLCMTMPGSDFSASNFLSGGLVYLGSDSTKPYTNHNKSLFIRGFGDANQTVYLTNSAGTNFLVEAGNGSNYWAVMHAGGSDNNAGYPAINLIIGTGIAGPTNCLFVGNTISNLCGPSFVLVGQSNTVLGNRITALHSFESFRMRSGFQYGTIRSNLVLDCKNIIWFDAIELGDTNLHPSGATLYDYNVGFVHAFGASLVSNIFEFNWLQNVEQQLGLVSLQDSNNIGFTIRSNVFIGIADQMSGSMNELTYDHNTFYRCGYQTTVPLALGGAHSQIQTNLRVTQNAWVDCGYHKDHTIEGWFTLLDCFNQTVASNFGCSAEMTGWAAKNVTSTNTLAYNGGNPGFFNTLKPLGDDGLPFTSDDGMRPLASCSVGSNGVGALPPITNIAAAFSVLGGYTNWYHPYYTNYGNLKTLLPGMRGGPFRPWQTPDPITNGMLVLAFSAAHSQSGLYGTNAFGIKNYNWDFGDGATAVSYLPTVHHTYISTGTFLVKLSITNFLDEYSSCSNQYIILPTNVSWNVKYVTKSGNDTTGDGSIGTPWLTVQKAVNNLTDGMYVSVGAGLYNELVNCNTTIGPTGVKLLSYGADVGSFELRKSYYYLEGFHVTSSNMVGASPVLIYRQTTNITFVNGVIGPFSNSVSDQLAISLDDTGGDGNPNNSQQSITVSNVLIQNVDSLQIVGQGMNHRFQSIIFRDGDRQADLFRMWGFNHVMTDFFAERMGLINENHADIFQIWGHGDGNGNSPIDVYSSNIVIQKFVVLNSKMQVCQMENYTNPPTYITNIYFRNGIIQNVNGQANVDIDGTRWHNLLFVDAVTNSGHVFTFGGTKGSAYGTEIKNTIFLRCGTIPALTTHGWYGWMEAQSISNYSLTADYNYVIGSNYAVKATAPPSGDGKWGSSGGVPVTAWEAHGINGGNPRLFNDTNYNYLPDGSSPVINAGVTISSFSDDILGKTRSTWDIGPFEVQGANTPITLEMRSKTSLRRIRGL